MKLRNEQRDIRQRPDGTYELWTKLSAIGCRYTTLVAKDKDGVDLVYPRTGFACVIRDYAVDVIVFTTKDLKHVIHAKHHLELPSEWRV